MWQNEPGVFEMMMKFFYLYNEDFRDNVKTFELSCRDFLEDIFMHYEKCAIKRLCSCCQKHNETSPDKPLQVVDSDIEEVKKEADEDELRESTDFSSFVLSPVWQEEKPVVMDFEVSEKITVEMSSATTVTRRLKNEEEEVGVEETTECLSDSAAANLSSPAAANPEDSGGLNSWSMSLPPAHLPSRIVQELGAGLKRNPTKRCRLCYRERRARRETRYWCRDCPTKPGLCIDPCFRVWHQMQYASNRSLAAESFSARPLAPALDEDCAEIPQPTGTGSEHMAVK